MSSPASHSYLLVTLEEGRRAVLYADSYSRLDCLVGLMGGMETDDWWRLLGEEWTGCDNIAKHRLLLASELRMAGRNELDLMMSAEELEQHRALPDMLTVFRGCYGHNRVGLSWTLDRAVAERFPRLMRYRRSSPPLLLTGRVRKQLCVLKTDRNEAEIISAHVRRVAQARLDLEVTA